MPPGRPRAQIDLDKVRELAKDGCTIADICNTFGIHPSTYYRNEDAKRAYAEGQAVLFRSLRARQVKLALDGNASMLIWLGKNLLGQTDKQELVESLPAEFELRFDEAFPNE